MKIVVTICLFVIALCIAGLVFALFNRPVRPEKDGIIFAHQPTYVYFHKMSNAFAFQRTNKNPEWSNIILDWHFTNEFSLTNGMEGFIYVPQ